MYLLPRLSTFVVDLGPERGRMHVTVELLEWLFENRANMGGIAPPYALVAVHGKSVVTGWVR